MTCSKLSLLILGLILTHSGVNGGLISEEKASGLTVTSPVNLQDPEVLSVRRAKVQTLTSQQSNPPEKDNNQTSIKITTYTAEAEPESLSPETKPQTIQFSKLISKEPSKPLKFTVSLFEETKKKPQQFFSVVPHPQPLQIELPLELENQIAVTQFEPMRMVETRDKILQEGYLQESQPELGREPPTLQYFHTHPALNYQYFNQPRLQYYSPPLPLPTVPVQENEVEPKPTVREEGDNTLQPLPQYNFIYRVHDSETGTDHGHTEMRYGNVVYGRYALMDADGLLRTVSYTSDPVYGFNALVDRTPAAAASHNFVNHIISPQVGRGYHHHHHGHGLPGFFSYTL